MARQRPPDGYEFQGDRAPYRQRPSFASALAGPAGFSPGSPLAHSIDRRLNPLGRFAGGTGGVEAASPMLPGMFDKGALAPNALSAMGSESWVPQAPAPAPVTPPAGSGGGAYPGGGPGGYSTINPPNLSALLQGGPFSGNRLQQDVLQRGYASGAFDPFGSPFIMQLLEQMGRDEGRARERHAVLGAELDAGDDPLLRAYLGGEARLGAQSDTARSLTEARVQQFLQYQRFIQELLGGYLGQAINRRDPRNGNPLAAVAGQVAGVAGGAWLSPHGK